MADLAEWAYDQALIPIEYEEDYIMAKNVTTGPLRTTPPVQVDFPAVFEKTSYQGGVPCFQITLLFNKRNKTHMEALKTYYNDAKQVLESHWPDPKTRPRIKLMGDDKSPIKDADKNCNQAGIPFAEGGPYLKDHYFIRCGSYLDTLRVVDSQVQPLTDPKQIYRGCVCRVSINAYSRTRTTNPGISFSVNAVQKWEDAQPFGGTGPALEDIFEANPDVNAGKTPIGSDDDDPFAGCDDTTSDDETEEDIPW